MSAAGYRSLPFNILRGGPFSRQILLRRDTHAAGTAPLRPVCGGRTTYCRLENCDYEHRDDCGRADPDECFHCLFPSKNVIEDLGPGFSHEKKHNRAMT